MTSISEARAAKETVKRLLVGVEGVSGIGIGWDDNGDRVVLVNVEKQAITEVKKLLSEQTIDVPVLIEEIGVIHFLRE